MSSLTEDERRTLSNYLDGERLKVIPRKESRKRIVLAWLVERFDVGVTYTESEVNALIGRSHPDFATLRRELYDRYFLDRKDNAYWRPPSAPGQREGHRADLK